MYLICYFNWRSMKCPNEVDSKNFHRFYKTQTKNDKSVKKQKLVNLYTNRQFLLYRNLHKNWWTTYMDNWWGLYYFSLNNTVALEKLNRILSNNNYSNLLSILLGEQDGSEWMRGMRLEKKVRRHKMVKYPVKSYFGIVLFKWGQSKERKPRLAYVL